MVEDIDILVLLIHHWDNSKNDVFFNTEKRQKLTKVNKWWNIVYFKGGNASDWMDILYVHAGGGCDNIGYSLQRLVYMFLKVVTCLH